MKSKNAEENLSSVRDVAKKYAGKNSETSKKICFDSDKYIKLQSAKIAERIKMFDNKLYLEFGGKIFDDMHASRVLPGFRPDMKGNMLAQLSDKTEVILCINAGDIEQKRVNSNLGINYEANLLRLMTQFEKLGIPTAGVVITLYTGQPAADKFAKQLRRRGIKTYFHTYTKGYPTDVDTIVSEKGYGAQPYVETTKPLVVVVAPGPNSGKLATCLSQLYHENQRGVRAGYAKFETFPVWDLPLKHPVNIAYEASTVDLDDINMIDNFYLEKYGRSAVNYNRDLAVFPILKNILHRITGEDLYASPTDMGVNVVGQCIVDDAGVRAAANGEIIRRYLDAMCNYRNGIWDAGPPERAKLLMDELGISLNDRPVVAAALDVKEKKKSEVVAIELLNGQMITGRDKDVMTASAAVVINAVKELSGIDEQIHLISPVNLDSMLKLKREVYRETQLNLLDVLAALAVSGATNPTAELALANLPKLKGLEAHSTVMLPKVEIDALKKLGLNITCTDEFAKELR